MIHFLMIIMMILGALGTVYTGYMFVKNLILLMREFQDVDSDEDLE